MLTSAECPNGRCSDRRRLIEHRKIDRIACPRLIRRFIDPPVRA